MLMMAFRALGDYYPEAEDDASTSSQAFNGDADETMSRDGYVETNGRKKRRTGVAAEDQDYRPPGTKRVCSTAYTLHLSMTCPFSVHPVVIPHGESKTSARSLL